MTTDHLLTVSPERGWGAACTARAIGLAIALAIAPKVTVADEVTDHSAYFDIPPQPVESALIELSRQADVQVMVGSDMASGRRANGIKGRLTVAHALTSLLNETGLTYATVRNTVAITRVSGSDGVPRTDTRRDTTASEGGAPKTKPQPAASAKPESDPHGPRRATLEEVVVSAQKRDESLQDVPISISVLDGAYLDKSSAKGMNELLGRVSGVSVIDNPQGGSQVTVRGVAAGSALFTGASPTAFYLDSVPFGFVKTAIGPDPDVYDLERLEVLRGPQGTLYGASALNGVVRVLTKDADLEAFQVKMRTSGSDTEDGKRSYRGDVVVNVPLIDGKVGARLVGGYQDLGGWIDRPNRRDANDGIRSNVRLKLNARPLEKLSLGASVWSSRSDSDAQSTGATADFNPSPLTEEPNSVNYQVYGFQVGYEFPAATISSTTSYLDYENALIVGASLAGPPILDQRLNAHTFAEELMLSSTAGAWRWSLGGMYRDSEDRLYQLLQGIFVAPTIQNQGSKSVAVFGELTRSLLDGRFELTAGLRHFEDKVAQRELSRSSGVPSAELISTNSNFDALTPRAVATWHLGKLMTTYASYSEGFRSGSAQNPAVLAIAPLPAVKPDKLKNYEIGLKGSMLDGRLQLDTAVYYIDWKDVQQALTVQVVTQGFQRNLTAIVNGKSASGAGVDLALSAAPVDAFEFGVNASWNDLKSDDDVLSAGVVLFEAGSRLNYSPKYTAGAWADYIFRAGSSLEWRFSAGGNYTAAQPTRALSNGVSIEVPSDSMLITRASLTARSVDRWSASLFVDNINDEDGSPTRFPGATRFDARVRPRTVGVQLEYSF